MATDLTFGQRLRNHRERAGKTRAVLGGLVGKSEEWVKAVESGRLLTPRLPMLLRLAEVLGLDDLAELTGEQPVPVASITKAGHSGTPAIGDAMKRAVRPVDQPPTLADITTRVSRAWVLWHQSYEERTALGGLLPGLITDSRRAVRTADPDQRRPLHAALASVYHLAQLFLAFQPVEELVWLSADRAAAAADAADDPLAIARAAWYYAHVYRSDAQPDAAEAAALDALALLDPDSSTEHRAHGGQLHLAVALAHAKAGRSGLAWRHWDLASDAAQALGAGYTHPVLMFGAGAVAAYGVTIAADLVQPVEAIRRSEAVDVATLPSRTRRAFYLLETARARRLRREYASVAYLLKHAARESSDTVRHSIFARAATLELLEHRGPIREDARELALVVGLLG
jgi:transcriptional regulator with XRE-family HTH domain